LPSEISVIKVRKAGDCFCVVTPRLTTSDGRRDSAWETRFCTSTCALFGSVPGAKVIVICSTPSEPATDFMYIMFSTPLICSSSGDDTVSAMTLGLAPG
jgi:pyruvate/2-oxoglutarate/acetoin dehydrogenase E1 component